MKQISNYILEKLKLDKDTNVCPLEFPVKIGFWSNYESIYQMRDVLHDYSNIIRFGITDTKQHGVNGYKLYSIEVENEKDLLSLLIFCYFYSVNREEQLRNFKGMNIVEDFIENYKDIEDYIKYFSNAEYQDALDEIIKLHEKK